ncbi:type II secretion system protein GspM [Propionivibrio limicola]|uniref:type II secretion system protein GspM n=1 Tax=Propionivibrio limicola TaxID=167645 RepID=UPI00129205C9|nr:type II secretion system protein GspM [Propionivibrio limicola]
MKVLWQRLAGRYDSLQLRERWLIAAALLGGIVLVGYSLFIDPSLKRAGAASRTLTEQQAQLANVRQQLTALQAPERHPDVAARVELEMLNRQLADLAGRLSVFEGSLVLPQKMPVLLEAMVGQGTGLRLLSLKTLPVAPLLDGKPAGQRGDGAVAGKSDEKSDGKAAPGGTADTALREGLFKHGVEIRLEGSYAELLAYLDRLEQSKMKLLWSNVDLSAEKYPKLVLTLTVYTLSMDKAWLIV